MPAKRAPSHMWGSNGGSTCPFLPNNRQTQHHHHIPKVGQDHVYTVYIRYSWQRNHHIYGPYVYGVYKRFWPTLHIPIHTYTHACRAHTTTHTLAPCRQHLLLPHRLCGKHSTTTTHPDTRMHTHIMQSTNKSTHTHYAGSIFSFLTGRVANTAPPQHTQTHGL